MQTRSSDCRPPASTQLNYTAVQRTNAGAPCRLSIQPASRNTRFIAAIEPEKKLDARPPFIAAVFPVAAIAALNRSKTVDQFDTHYVFRHLVAKLALGA